MRPVNFGRALLLETPRNPNVQNSPDNNRSHLIYGQLVRLGNLLNQMMRHCHRSGDQPPADLAPLLKDIRQIIARVNK